MTVEEMIQSCKDRYAEPSSNFFKPEMWLRWLNEGQRTVVRQTKVLERSAKTSTVPGARSYHIGDDFWSVRIVKLDDRVLYPESLDDMDERFLSIGTPYKYTLWGKSLYLSPTPSGTHELMVRYYAWPTPLVDDTDEPEIPEAFHELLPTFAVYRAHQTDRNLPEADRLYAEFNDGVLQLLESLSERQDQWAQVRDVSTSMDFMFGF